MMLAQDDQRMPINLSFMSTRHAEVLHTINYKFRRKRRSSVKVPSLEDSCCRCFAANTSFIKHLDPARHAHLYPRILMTVLLKGDEASLHFCTLGSLCKQFHFSWKGCSQDVIESLVTTWPRRILSLAELRSFLFVDEFFLRPLVDVFLNLAVSKRLPLKVLDLGGYLLCATLLTTFLKRVLSMHQESDPEINTSCSTTDQTRSLVDASTQNCVLQVYFDCFIGCNNFSLLCQALEPRSMSMPAVRLHVSRFESMTVDFQSALETLNPEDLLGLRLCYDASRHDGQLRVLQRFHLLQTLSLRISMLSASPELCAELGDVLGSFPKLRHLELSHGILQDCLHRVLDHVANFKLECLDLSNSDLSSNDLTYLAKAGCLASLLELNLGRNVVLSKEFSVTLSLLESAAASLHFLEIGDCNFSDSQLEPLVKCVKGMRQLVHLNICNVAFTSTSVRALIPPLAALPNLESVLLSHPKVCDEENDDWLIFRFQKAQLELDLSSSARAYRHGPHELELHFIWVER